MIYSTKKIRTEAGVKAQHNILMPANDAVLDCTRPHGKVTSNICKGVTEMSKNIYAVVYSLALIALIVGVDLMFFKHRFWERLIANIGIVLVFTVVWLRFLKNL